VRKAAESPQASVRQRAAALLRALGADAAGDAPAAAPDRAPGARSGGAAVADLIGGMEEPADVAAPAPAPSDDLLGIFHDWSLL
jgi:hypothetical protein